MTTRSRLLSLLAVFTAALAAPAVSPAASPPATPAWQAPTLPTATPHLPPAEKRAVSAAFARFVQPAVRRRHVGRAWNLVTPALRAATSRADWARGSLPVYPYPAAGRHQPWTPSVVSRDDVLFDVLLHAKNPRKMG